MNVIEIIGNLGKDPETRFTPSGQKVTTLVLASNSKRGGKEETTWWRATLWGDKFDKMLTYLKKGSLIMVIGEMHKPEIFTNKDGQSQVSMEMTADAIRFVPGRSDKAPQEGTSQTAAAGGYTPQSGAQSYNTPEQAVTAGQGNASPEMNDEDSLPF